MGVLVDSLMAPVAIVVDALSHLASAMLLWRIDAVDPICQKG